jgi:hypothetical protein
MWQRQPTPSACDAIMAVERPPHRRPISQSRRSSFNAETELTLPSASTVTVNESEFGQP